MLAPQTGIVEADSGHRRGVVLGLTLAEIMLLFLFCLLLVSFSVLKKKEEEISGLNGKLAAMPGIEVLIGAAFPAGGLPLPPGAMDDLKMALGLVLRLRAEGLSANSPEIAALLNLDANDLTKIAKMPAMFGIPETGMTENDLKRISKAADLLREAELKAADSSARNGLSSAPEADDGHQWPPIITLDDNDYRFKKGSAELTANFRQSLENEKASEVAQLLKAYNADIIEVIGHTDEDSYESTKTSNMDRQAILVLNNKAQASDLVPVDNAGLGLARAVSVAQVFAANAKLAGARVIPYSAAQLVMRGDLIANGTQGGDQGLRRRIEIRIRRSGSAE